MEKGIVEYFKIRIGASLNEMLKTIWLLKDTYFYINISWKAYLTSLKHSSFV